MDSSLDQAATDVELPYLDGESRLVLPPEPSVATGEWYINDHCFIEDVDGILHFFGINNPYPSSNPDPYTDAEVGIYDEHPYVGHATSTDPTGTWDRQPHALVDEREGGHVGAPEVVWVDDRDEYVMILKTGLEGRSDRLELVTSTNLTDWHRSETFVLADLPPLARDPCIQRADDGSFRLYVCGDSLASGGAAIFVTETADFETFEPIRECLVVDDAEGSGAESPFVVRRHGLYYLFFTFAHRHYYETIVCVSDQYDEFSMNHVVTTLYSHAPEIFEYDGTTYISSCGAGGTERLNEHGLYLAELNWTTP